jgi:hypothetical protein
MKSSQVIICVSTELQANFSETIAVSVVRVDVMSGLTVQSICTHSWLLELSIPVHEGAIRDCDWSLVVSHHSMCCLTWTHQAAGCC